MEQGEIINSEYQNIINILRLKYEKDRLIYATLGLIKKDKRGLKKETTDRLLEQIKPFCQQIRQLMIKEQDLEKYYKKSKDEELSEVKELKLKEREGLNVLKEKRRVFEPTNPRIIAFLQKIDSLSRQFEEDDGRILKELTKIFHIMKEIINLNLKQIDDLKNIFEKKTFLIMIIDTPKKKFHRFIDSVKKENLLLLELIKSFKKNQELEKEANKYLYSEEQYKEYVTSISGISKEQMENHMKIHPFLLKIIRDRKTMQANAKEQFIIREAEKLGIRMLSEDQMMIEQIIQDSNYVIFYPEYASLDRNSTPVIRKELKNMIEFIESEWKKRYDEVFDKEFYATLNNRLGVEVKTRLTPLISSLTRSVQEQIELMPINIYATHPEKSTHVRGLAVDFSLSSILNNFCAEVKKDYKKQIDEETKSMIKSKILDLLKLITHNMQERQQLFTIVEANGCFHVSVNPSSESFREFRDAA